VVRPAIDWYFEKGLQYEIAASYRETVVVLPEHVLNCIEADQDLCYISAVIFGVDVFDVWNNRISLSERQPKHVINIFAQAVLHIEC